MTETDTKTTCEVIPIDHIKITSRRSFADVRKRLEDLLPKLDVSIVRMLRSGDLRGATDYENNGPKLSIFEQRDFGALLETFGGSRHALQYEIGNPLTASKMTRYQLSAALYAPLRVVLLEDEHGRGAFEYDEPSSMFGQFGDERVTEVARYLDAELQTALRKAAG